MGRTVSTRILLAALACAHVAACKNSNYCEGNPNNDCRTALDAPPDETTSCTSSSSCPAQTPACDTAAGICVQCIAPNETTACAGTTPVCDAGHTCRACEAHAECTSLTCLPDGSCADPSQVAYVSASGNGAACTQADPCPLLADALALNLPYIKIAMAGAGRASSTTAIDGKPVTILAEPGAVLDRDGDGPILEVKSANAVVSIYDLTISGATSASGVGVLLTPNGGTPELALIRTTVTNNQGGGISTTGGSLSVTQSTIATNQGGGISTTGGSLSVARSTIATNQGGGISVSGGGATFSITNNFIYRNGDQDIGTYGGVNLGVATAGSNVFAFNTVTDNRASPGGTRSGGVICDIVGFTGPNNIIARNALGTSTGETNSQTLGACTYPTSKVQNDVSELAFADPEAPAPFNYKLTRGSTAIDFATTSSTIDVDHDGDIRPQGTHKDCGADEYKP